MSILCVNPNLYYTKNKDKLNIKNHNNDDIYLIFQFFIHQDKKRYSEIKYCLKKNIELGIFKKIILLNEKIYTKEELGLNEEEIKYITQINIIERLKYNHIFKKVRELNLNGYIVFCNSDIFFDKTILNIRKSILSKEKSVYTLLRFEYKNEKKLGYCKLFNHPKTGMPRNDSQDTWIYHTTQFQYNKLMMKELDFQLGMPGCDNKITFILTKYGYTCYNEPWNIKTYHYHMTNIRNYKPQQRINPPYLIIDIGH